MAAKPTPSQEDGLEPKVLFVNLLAGTKCTHSKGELRAGEEGTRSRYRGREAPRGRQQLEPTARPGPAQKEPKEPQLEEQVLEGAVVSARGGPGQDSSRRISRPVTATSA